MYHGYDGKAKMFPDSSNVRDFYLAGLWWTLHHSTDPSRSMAVLTCYLDKSGTDNSSEVAVVGGLILDMSQFRRLDKEWHNILNLHNIPWPLHMKEFGLHGKLKDMRSEARRSFFSDLSLHPLRRARASFQTSPRAVAPRRPERARV